MQIEKRRLKKPSLFDFLHESAGGGRAAPMALHGAKGEILFQKRTSPFGTPKRKAGGVSTSPPAPPNDQKGGA